MSYLYVVAAKVPAHVQQTSAAPTITASIGVVLLIAAFVLWRMGMATILALSVGAAAGVALPSLGGVVLSIFAAVAHAITAAPGSVGAG